VARRCLPVYRASYARQRNAKSSKKNKTNGILLYINYDYYNNMNMQSYYNTIDLYLDNGKKPVIKRVFDVVPRSW